MAENTYKFDLPEKTQSIIKVIGVGGGGSNAVNHMYNQGIRDVEFVVCNTDAQALLNSPVPIRLQIGATLTEGLGAGANPARGRDAALESKEEISEFLSNHTKMVFITAGMGGGTGTGAAPVIARIAKEKDILTVAIVTAPFSFEGRIKKENAYEGIEELKQSCDTVLVILNDRLRDIYGELPKSKAFAEADNVLANAAKSIAEIITVPGYVNVDFEDVKKVMKNAGQAVMGSAIAQGENRARKVIEEALNSPLLNNRDIRGAKKILLAMFYSSVAEMTMDEQSIITDYIEEKTGKEVDELILGDVIDDTLGQNLRVTIIATGFDDPFDMVVEKKKTTVEPDVQPKLLTSTHPDFSPLPAEPAQTSVPMNLVQPEELPQPAEVAAGSFQQQMDKEQVTARDAQYRRMMDRRERIKRPGNELTPEDLRERLETPAFIRRKIRLYEMPDPSEQNVNLYYLTDEDQLLNNRRFSPE